MQSPTFTVTVFQQMAVTCLEERALAPSELGMVLQDPGCLAYLLDLGFSSLETWCWEYKADQRPDHPHLCPHLEWHPTPVFLPGESMDRGT